MNNRLAVLDLGTNTFHLLIAEGNMPNVTILKHVTKAVKLGEGGINDGIIRPDAYRRGISALQHFSEIINEHQPVVIKAIGTSALRSAANGAAFITEAEAGTGIVIEIIDGHTEASYIYNGIKAANYLTLGNNLIADIGGGSVELIWCSPDQIYWKQSFEIGAARLMAKFHQQDPMPENEQTALFTYLDERLAPLFEAIGQQHINTLIGSSGAFETFAEIIAAENNVAIDWQQQINYTFDTDKLTALFDTLATSSHWERASNQLIPTVRVDMIVVAAALTKYLMDKLYPDKVRMSAYSLKEGVMAEMLGL